MRRHNQSEQVQKIAKYLLKDYTFLHDYIIIDPSISSSHHHGSMQGSFQHMSATYGNLGPNFGNQAGHGSQNCQVFVAQIAGSDQLVKFNKINYSYALMPRFQALVELYEQGIVLLDNLFILQQAKKLYFYIIQAFVSETPQHHKQNTHNLSLLTDTPYKRNRFITLKKLINDPSYSSYSLQKKTQLIDKIKILIDCVHQTGQPYVCLNTSSVIIDLDDQEGGVYLAPFQLQVEVQFGFNTCKNREKVAYLAPEILLMETKQNGGNQVININNSMLFKNDIWSFGCVMLQILFYCCPAFYSLNNINQYKLIQVFISPDKNNKQLIKSQIGFDYQEQFHIRWCVQKLLYFDQSISRNQSASETDRNRGNVVSNLLLNCLQMQETKRLLTSQRDCQDKFTIINTAIGNRTKQRYFSSGKYTTKSSENKFEKTINKTKIQLELSALNSPINAIKQNKNKPKDIQVVENKYENERCRTKSVHIDNVNLNSDVETKSQLILELISISNARVNKQLRINVYLDRKYSIFVTEDKSNTIKINKTIIVRSAYKNLRQLLSAPFIIELVQKSNNANQKQSSKDNTIIQVNLSTLVILQRGVRVWTKPIIGSYCVKSGTRHRFPDAQIKIKAEVQVQKEMQQRKNCHRNKSINVLNSMQNKHERSHQNMNQFTINDDLKQEIKKTIKQRKLLMDKVKEKLKKKQAKNQNINQIGMNTEKIQQQQKIQINKQQKSKLRRKVNQPLTELTHTLANLQQSSQTNNKIQKNNKLTLSENSCFESINKNLEQICQKWKNKVNDILPLNSINMQNKKEQNKKKQQKQKKEQVKVKVKDDSEQYRIKLKKAQKLNSQEQLSVPLSIQRNYTRKGEEIDDKIKKMLNKLGLQ